MKKKTKLFLKKYIPQSVIDFYFIMAGNRYKKMLLGISREDLGLEIGPSHRPVAPKKDGYHVEILDYLSREELVDKYKDHGVDLNAIEDVDYIWKGGRYSDVTGKKDYYDYILSSHSIEHSTNFIGFLQDCSGMVKENGIISLAVPDKRQCFDCYRPVTTTREVIDDYYRDQDFHSAGSVAEYLLDSVKKDGKLSWDRKKLFPDRGGDYAFIHDYPYAKSCIRAVREREEFMDIHQYVFIPESFRLLILDLKVLGYIDLEVERCFRTVGNEFIVSLRKSFRKPEPDYPARLKLLKKIRKKS